MYKNMFIQKMVLKILFVLYLVSEKVFRLHYSICLEVHFQLNHFLFLVLCLKEFVFSVYLFIFLYWCTKVKDKVRKLACQRNEEEVFYLHNTCARNNEINFLETSSVNFTRENKLKCMSLEELWAECVSDSS